MVLERSEPTRLRDRVRELEMALSDTSPTVTASTATAHIVQSSSELAQLQALVLQQHEQHTAALQAILRSEEERFVLVCLCAVSRKF